MDSMDRASLASLFGQSSKSKKRDRSQAEQNRAVDIMAHRLANNLDLWTGEPRKTTSDKPEIIVDDGE